MASSEFAWKRKFRFKYKLVSLDSTLIDLRVQVFDWAKFRRIKGAIKLLLVLDNGYVPAFGVVTEGKIHDVKVAQQLAFASSTVPVDDMGYNAYRLFANWIDEGHYFVTRCYDRQYLRRSTRRYPCPYPKLCTC